MSEWKSLIAVSCRKLLSAETCHKCHQASFSEFSNTVFTYCHFIIIAKSAACCNPYLINTQKVYVTS